MNMQDAIDNDHIGMALGYTSDGRVAAEVIGPGHWLSKRKRKKRSKGVRVRIWTPPRPDIVPGHLAVRCQVRQQRLSEVSKETRRLLDSLDWRPYKVRSAIDRLAHLARRL